jgi:Mce-associated membrane protein
MRAVRVVMAVVALAGVVTVLWVLGPPGWLVPPAVALGIAVVGLAVVVTPTPRPRRVVDLVLTGVAAAMSIAAIVVVLVTPRDTGPDDEGLRGRAVEAVTAYLTVPSGAAEPDAVAGRLRALTPMVTDRALADLRSQGPDAALPGAVSTDATQQVAVQAVGVAAHDGDTARLLVYGVVRVTIPRVSPEPASASIARWAVMRRVDGTWRLADLYPVGPGG